MRTQRLARSSRSPELTLPPAKSAAPDIAKVAIASAVSAECEKKAASPPQPRMAKLKKAPVPTTISVNLTVDIARFTCPAVYRLTGVWGPNQPIFGEREYPT